MGVLAFVLLGLICAAIARSSMASAGPSVPITLVIGVLGALLGGFVTMALFGTRPMGSFWDPSSWLIAIIGSILLLLIWRADQGRRG